MKTPKMPKNECLKYREQDFSQTCGFLKVLDNVELITYMKFQKILITGCIDMGKNCIKNAPKMFFFHLRPPKISFLQNSRSVTFIPLWYPKVMQKIRKTNELSLKRKGGRTHRHIDRHRDKGDYPSG